jgi:hypothetical protein
MKKTVTALGLLAIVATGGWAFGQMPGDGRRPGPPPEAITACEGRRPGDTVQFQSPRGETITATCREVRGQLVAVPEGGLHGRRPGPPPEAFQACDGKNQGDAVQFHTPRGETITATCRLVAVPQE